MKALGLVIVQQHQAAGGGRAGAGQENVSIRFAVRVLPLFLSLLDLFRLKRRPATPWVLCHQRSHSSGIPWREKRVGSRRRVRRKPQQFPFRKEVCPGAVVL